MHEWVNKWIDGWMAYAICERCSYTQRLTQAIFKFLVDWSLATQSFSEKHI